MMRGKLWGLLLLTILLTFGWTGQAEANPEERTYISDGFEYTFDDETGYIWILAYVGREREITVPAEIYGTPVKYIRNLGDSAVYPTYDARISKVTISEGIEYLSGMDYFLCLREINIPESVTEIGYEAFYQCRKLKKVNFPKGLKQIGESAFSGCRSLKEIQLPEGLESIGDYAFVECSLIEEVEVPSTVKTLGVEVFCTCENLKRVTLPNGLKTIPRSAFWGCEKLRSINLPKNLEIIEEDAFLGTAIKQITIPSKVKEIGWYSFAGCGKLKKITIKSKKIKSIGKGAFSNIHAKAVFDVPNKSITKYKNLLVKSKSFKNGKVKVK